jgi:hypothetical protein
MYNLAAQFAAIAPIANASPAQYNLDQHIA